MVSGELNGRVINAIGLLARAVQRHRIYPPSSPLCLESVEACLSALEGLPAEAVKLRVSPTQIFHGSDAIPGSSVVTELTERLFRADVEELSLRRATPPKELARFCRQLATWDRRRDQYESFIETLNEQGVTSIRTRSANKLEVLDLEIITAERLAQLSEERDARAPEDQRVEGEARLQAWIQVDTDCDIDSIDLVDLAFLLDDQSDLAQVLYDIAEGGPQSATGAEALCESVAELTELYSSLSPRIAEQRFSDLARTLMTLDEKARNALTRDVLLPDLLETDRAAPLLRLLPDAEIIDAVRTLADLEVDAPGLIKLALDRLALPEDQRITVAGAVGGPIGVDEANPDLEPSSPPLSGDGAGRDLREYTVHELSVDEETIADLNRIKREVEASTEPAGRLRCYANLVRHLRNPDHAEDILKGAEEILAASISNGGTEAAEWVEEFRRAADSVREHRPEIAELVDDMMLTLCSPEFLRAQAQSWVAQGGSVDESRRLLTAFGPASIDALIHLLEEEQVRAVRRRLVDFMCENAAAFAPELVRYVSDERWTVVRNVVRIIGFAGPGHEPELAPAVGHPEERVAREALLALARIGSPEAVDLIAGQLGDSDPSRRAMAEEAIRTLPVEEGRRQVRGLLGDPAFFRRYPGLARSLVQRFAPGRGGDWEDILLPMASVRFRLWRPRLMALGWTAAAALRESRG